MSNPLGDFDFPSRLPPDLSQLLLLPAGTGFTPMAKLLLTYLRDPAGPRDRVACMLFFNKTEQDIIWRRQLDSLAAGMTTFIIKLTY